MAIIIPGKFSLPRSLAIQPNLQIDDIVQGVQSTVDPVVINMIFNFLSLWTQIEQQTPEDFLHEFKVINVERQPLIHIHAITQHVSRVLEPVDLPSDGSDVNANRFKETDVFKLSPIKTLEFPRESVFEAVSIPGNESLSVCDDCKGSGNVECEACQAGGVVACPGCSGAQQVVCSSCEGAGILLGGAGSRIQCSKCRGAGVYACNICKGHGEIKCARCKGKGEEECSTCDGHGTLRRTWELQTNTSIIEQSKAFLYEEWPVKLNALISESNDIDYMDWEWPLNNMPKWSMSDASASLVSAVNEQIKTTLAHAKSVLTENDRMTGFRLKFCGTYLYKVSIEYKGHIGKFYIGGNSNQIFCENVPRRNSGFFKKIDFGLKKLFSFLDKTLVGGPDPDYLQAIRNGSGHVNDYYATVHHMVKNYKCKLDITSEGYSLTLPSPFNAIDGQGCLTFQISFGVCEQKQTISAKIKIGKALRHKFPIYLSMNQAIHFGRFGIQEETVGQYLLWLIDNRFYDTLDSEAYFFVLSEMALFLQQITKRGELIDEMEY